MNKKPTLTRYTTPFMPDGNCGKANNPSPAVLQLSTLNYLNMIIRLYL